MTLEQEIAAHPYIVALVVALLFAALVGLSKLFMSRMEGRINEKFSEQEKHNLKQDGRLDSIEADLRRYDTHVAVGTTESREIHEAVRRVETALSAHVEKEETVTWSKIDELVDAVNTMRLHNEKDHAGLVTGQATLGVRMDAVEKKMPNGELKKLADAYHALAVRDTEITPPASGRRRRKVR